MTTEAIKRAAGWARAMDPPMVDKAAVGQTGPSVVGAVLRCEPAELAAGSADLMRACRLPEPAIDDVDDDLAQEAWGDIAMVLFGAPASPASGSKGQQHQEDDQVASFASCTPGTTTATDLPTLASLRAITESMARFYSHLSASPEGALMALQTQNVKAMAEMLKADMDTMSMLRNRQMNAILDKTRKDMEAAEKQGQIDKKAKKSQVLGLAFNFGMAVVQIATGAAKLAVGQPSGALDIVAGSLGLARATMQAIVLEHPELADKLQPHMERLGKAEMAFALAAMATSILELPVVRTAMRSALKKATEGVLKNESLLSSLPNLMNSADKVAAKAAQVGISEAEKAVLKATEAEVRAQIQVMIREVAQQISDSARQILQGMLPGGEKVFNFLTRSFSPDVLESIVTKAIKEVAEEGRTLRILDGNRLMNRVLEHIESSVIREVNSIARMVRAPCNVLRTAQSVAKPFLDYKLINQTGTLRQELDQLQIQMTWLTFMIEYGERDLRHLKERMEQDAKQYTENEKDIATALRRCKDVALQTAAQMA